MKAARPWTFFQNWERERDKKHDSRAHLWQVKFRRGMLQFLDYELCDSTLREVTQKTAEPYVFLSRTNEHLRTRFKDLRGVDRVLCRHDDIR